MWVDDLPGALLVGKMLTCRDASMTLGTKGWPHWTLRCRKNRTCARGSSSRKCQAKPTKELLEWEGLSNREPGGASSKAQNPCRRCASAMKALKRRKKISSYILGACLSFLPGLDGQMVKSIWKNTLAQGSTHAGAAAAAAAVRNIRGGLIRRHPHSKARNAAKLQFPTLLRSSPKTDKSHPLGFGRAGWPLTRCALAPGGMPHNSPTACHSDGKTASSRYSSGHGAWNWVARDTELEGMTSRSARRTAGE